MGRRRSASPRWEAEGIHRSLPTALGELYLTQGDLAHAIRVLEQGLALCRASGNRLGATIAADLGFAYALQGRLAEGARCWRRRSAKAIRTGARHGHSGWVAWLSESSRLAGAARPGSTRARPRLGPAAQRARQRGAYALHQLGVVQAHADPPDAVQAEAHYQQALALADELGMRPLQAHGHLGLGTLYATTGQRQQARRSTVHSHRDVSRHGDDLVAPTSRGWRLGAGGGGWYRWSKGHSRLRRQVYPSPPWRGERAG